MTHIYILAPYCHALGYFLSLFHHVDLDIFVPASSPLSDLAQLFSINWDSLVISLHWLVLGFSLGNGLLNYP